MSMAVAYDNLVGTASDDFPMVDRVVPGDSANSYMWLKLTDDASIMNNPMPNGAYPLNMTGLDTIQAWIDGGAPEN
jgi:hypothetical protein